MSKEEFTIISGPIRQDETISFAAKYLYGEIAYKSRIKGFCWASNQTLADSMKISYKALQRCLKELTDAGYITASGMAQSRKIFVVKGLIRLDINVQGDHEPKLEHWTNMSSVPGQICPHKNKREEEYINTDESEKKVDKYVQAPSQTTNSNPVGPTQQPVLFPGAVWPAPAEPVTLEGSEYWEDQRRQFLNNQTILETLCIQWHFTAEKGRALMQQHIANMQMDGVVKPLSEIRKHFRHWINRGTADGFILKDGSLKTGYTYEPTQGAKNHREQETTNILNQLGID